MSDDIVAGRRERGGMGVRGLISLFSFAVWCPLGEVTSVGDGKDPPPVSRANPTVCFQSSSWLLGEQTCLVVAVFMETWAVPLCHSLCVCP